MVEFEKIWSFISGVKNLLLVLPERPTVDMVAGARALALVLRAEGKVVNIACSGDMPREAAFLLSEEQVLTTLSSKKQYIVLVKTKDAPLEQLSYEVFENQVKIFLTPQKGEYTDTDIQFVTESENQFEAIICLGAKDLEDLGELFTSQTEVFYNQPKLVIDTHVDNTLFGTLNIIEVTGSGICELLGKDMLTTKDVFLSTPVYTALLCGITAATHSFQHAQTAPQALELAGELIKRGAEQQRVVQELFKTRSLPLLQLWGRLLARMRNMEESTVIYSALSLSDFQKTTTSGGDILTILFDVLDNMSDFSSFLILSEPTEGDISLVVASNRAGVSLEDLALELGSALDRPQGEYAGYKYAYIPLTTHVFSEAEEQVFGVLKKIQSR